MAGGRRLALDGAAAARLRMHQAMLLVIAHRLGADDHDVAEALLAATVGAESPLMAAYHDHGRALADDRPAEALEAVAASYERMGMAVHAAETWVEASEAHRLAGNAAAARRSSSRAWSLLDGPAAGARTPIVVRLVAPELTDRERQLALLAAAGRSNADITAQLHLGVRTVEWHLSQAYAKLGVRRRTELAGILGPT